MRFFRRGLSKVRFVPAVASLAAPTATEINGGIDLSEQIAAINGFQFTNSPIPTPDLNSTFTTSIPGEDTTDTPSLDLYDSKTDTTLRAGLSKGTTGVIILLPYGWSSAGGDRAECWPVESTGINDQWTVDNDAAKVTVAFAVTGVPEQNAVTPSKP